MAGWSDAELDALVEQAIVDAYDESEQLASFHVLIEEHLAIPFRTTVLENDLEPPVPAGLGALTAPQRALGDFLRLDTGLLTIAAQASLPLAETKDDPRALAKWIRDLPAGDKDTLLCRVAQGHGAQVQMELRRRFRGDLGPASDSRPRRTVAELLDAAAEARR